MTKKKCIRCGETFEETNNQDDRYDYVPLCADCELELDRMRKCKEFWTGDDSAYC